MFRYCALFILNLLQHLEEILDISLKFGLLLLQILISINRAEFLNFLKKRLKKIKLILIRIQAIDINQLKLHLVSLIAMNAMSLTV